MKISMKLVYQYVVIFFNFKTTSNHLHRNSRLVVDDDVYGKFRLERVIYGINHHTCISGPVHFLMEVISDHRKGYDTQTQLH